MGNRRYPCKEAREIIKAAREIGWSHAGYTGSGHLLLIHENGAKFSIASTPGDNRNRKNAIRTLERLAGRRITTEPRKAS